MIKVVSFKICPFVQRVTAALEVKRIPYEIEYISLRDKPQWFLELSPTGQVPVLLTDSGIALFESDAIIEYIEDKYGPIVEGLNPEDKAIERAWSYQGSKNYLAQCSTMRSGNKEILHERSKNLAKAFEKVENQLGETKYFNGETVGKVDLAWIPLLHRAQIIESRTCYDLLAGFPKAKKWQEEVLKLDIVTKSVSEDFEDEFTAFYLSEKTYLGRELDCRVSTDQVCSSNSCC